MNTSAPVLVTGAAGFIGRHLVRRLAQSGARVRAVDVRPPPPEQLPGVAYEQGDIRDTELLRSVLQDVGVVHHLASVHLEVRAPEAEFTAVNVAAAEGLVRAAAEMGVRRLVHTSSVGVYGHVARPPAREDAPTAPETPYERTKLAGERAVLAMAERVGLSVIVLRPAWVYGPGCPRTAKLFRTLRRGRFFYIGRGANLRHPVYIDDMIDAYVLAADAPNALSGRAYIIAGPTAMPLRDMVGEFATAAAVPVPRMHIPVVVGRALAWVSEVAFGLVGRDAPFSRRSLAFFQNDNAFDTSAARNDLGFHPKVGLSDGLRALAEGA